MTKRQEQLREYVELLNDFGPDSEECREFRERLVEDEELASLARIATQLKIGLTEPVTHGREERCRND